MSYVSKEAIEKAREMDLLTYLRSNEPTELVHVSGKHFSTREHDSVRISNGKWYWFSKGIGGVSALDYLVKVRGYSFPYAVERILGTAPVMEEVHYYEPPKPREFVVPELSESMEKAVLYLRERGIHRDVINYCIKNRLIGETEQYHNVIFFGCDEKGVPRYACLRSTTNGFKRDVSGSDKHYAFQIVGEDQEAVHLFEAAIDLLSFASLEMMAGRNWKRDALLSLGGVAKEQNASLPPALSKFVTTHPKIRTIHLHLDNDEAGRNASQNIFNRLSGEFTVLDEPPATGKDVNDQLLSELAKGEKQGREAVPRRKEVTERE